MKGKVNNMAGRYGDKNPPMKYYDDYRNKYYNPDDEINRPGRNVNWKDIQQGFSLAAAKDDEQDSSITELEEKNAEQDTRLDAVEEKNAEQDTRIDAIEAEQEEQNGRLTAIETEQTEQNGRLTAIETEQTTQNNRLDAIETKDSEQDVALAAIRAKDADQDTAITNLTEDISDLETRMSDAEQDVQNENQRNTAQDQSISDNSVRITRLESSQATQDQQIASLITTSVDHGAAINNLNQQVAAAADKVRRVATDPPTSRSTRLGSDESNLTIAAAKDAEGTSVQITDTAGGDPIRVGFESDAGGDSIIIGDNSYKLGSGSTFDNLKRAAAYVAYSLSSLDIAPNSWYTNLSNVTSITIGNLLPGASYIVFGFIVSSNSNQLPLGYVLPTTQLFVADDNGEISANVLYAIYNTTTTVLTNLSLRCYAVYAFGG